jgi:hypothetical protein
VGHIAWSKNKYMQKFGWKVTGKTLERTRCRWKDNIKTDLEGISCKE